MLRLIIITVFLLVNSTYSLAEDFSVLRIPLTHGRESGRSLDVEANKFYEKEVLKALKHAKDALLCKSPKTKQAIEAIHQLAAWKHQGALSILIEAIEMHKNKEKLALEIVKGIRERKKQTVLSKKDIQGNSIVGAIWKSIGDYFFHEEDTSITRDCFELISNERGDSFILSFDFPSDKPFYGIEKFLKYMKQEFINTSSLIDLKVDVAHINKDMTEGEITISFDIDITNLTEFWRAVGTHDFKLNGYGFYRAFTEEELLEKIEEKTRMFMDGIKGKDVEAYKKLAKYIYGDGTEECPGLMNIIRSPESYGDLQFIKIESHPNKNRGKNRCSLNELLALAKYNPHFAHYIPKHGIQKWIFLARAAGSIFNTSYIKGLMRGYKDIHQMFFISRDTLGETRKQDLAEEIEKLTTGLYFDRDEGEEVFTKSVPNYTAVKLHMLKWFRGKYYKTVPVEVGDKKGWVKFRKCFVVRDELGKDRTEIMPVYDKPGSGAVKIGEIERYKAYGKNPEIVKAKLSETELSKDEISKIGTIGDERDAIYPYAIKTLYNQLKEFTTIFDDLEREDEKGEKIIPRICMIDELADGSWDFIATFAIEELSRIDEDDFDEEELRKKAEEILGQDLWHLRSAEPFTLTVAEIEQWEQLEETIKKIKETKDSIDVDIFIGYPRSDGAQATPGYPSMKPEILAKDFSVELSEAKKAAIAISEGADFIPHSFIVDTDRVSLLPLYNSMDDKNRYQATPIRLETSEVQLGAYLGALLFYNGVVDYYKNEYKRWVRKMGNIILDNNARVSDSVRREILNAFRDFPYLDTIDILVHVVDKYPAFKPEIEDVALDILSKMISEALDVDDNLLLDHEYLLHREELIKGLTGCKSLPRFSKKAKEIAVLIGSIKKKRKVMHVPFDKYIELSFFEKRKLELKSGVKILPIMSAEAKDIENIHDIVREYSMFPDRGVYDSYEGDTGKWDIKYESVPVEAIFSIKTQQKNL